MVYIPGQLALVKKAKKLVIVSYKKWCQSGEGLILATSDHKSELQAIKFERSLTF